MTFAALPDMEAFVECRTIRVITYPSILTVLPMSHRHSDEARVVLHLLDVVGDSYSITGESQ